jgi:hypothetical protein
MLPMSRGRDQESRSDRFIKSSLPVSLEILRCTFKCERDPFVRGNKLEKHNQGENADGDNGAKV